MPASSTTPCGPHGASTVCPTRAEALRIGVISDTHGLLRPEALDALAGVAHIIHAGDIGKPGIVETLAEIAPVTAIRGNVDTGPWARVYPERTTVELARRHVLVVHDRKEAGALPPRQRIAAVISGHSHRPEVEWVDGILYLNPGAAGPRRFRLPVTLALMRVGADDLSAEIVELPV